jgi:Ca2+-binding EF-hand superfamily protein
MDLPVLWTIFNRYDHQGHGKISDDNLIGLLIDVGLCPAQSQPGDDKVAAAMLLASAMGIIGDIDFLGFLRLIVELRSRAKEQARENLKERFETYDKLKHGELHFSEVYQILADFKMLPKSREEQQSIVSVIERLDTDGSGTFDFSEFQDLIQRLTEQVRFQAREQERVVILKMGFNELQLQHLRSSFLSMTPNSNGKIYQIGLVPAVHSAREKLCAGEVDEIAVRDITRVAQQTPDRQITFQEFAQSLKMVILRRDDDLDG